RPLSASGSRYEPRSVRVLVMRAIAPSMPSVRPAATNRANASPKRASSSAIRIAGIAAMRSRVRVFGRLSIAAGGAGSAGAQRLPDLPRELRRHQSRDVRRVVVLVRLEDRAVPVQTGQHLAALERHGELGARHARV